MLWIFVTCSIWFSNNLGEVCYSDIMGACVSVVAPCCKDDIGPKDQTVPFLCWEIKQNKYEEFKQHDVKYKVRLKGQNRLDTNQWVWKWLLPFKMISMAISPQQSKICSFFIVLGMLLLSFMFWNVIIFISFKFVSIQGDTCHPLDSCFCLQWGNIIREKYL